MVKIQLHRFRHGPRRESDGESGIVVKRTFPLGRKDTVDGEQQSVRHPGQRIASDEHGRSNVALVRIHGPAYGDACGRREQEPIQLREYDALAAIGHGHVAETSRFRRRYFARACDIESSHAGFFEYKTYLLGVARCQRERDLRWPGHVAGFQRENHVGVHRQAREEEGPGVVSPGGVLPLGYRGAACVDRDVRLRSTSGVANPATNAGVQRLE